MLTDAFRRFFIQLDGKGTVQNQLQSIALIRQSYVLIRSYLQ